MTGQEQLLDDALIAYHEAYHREFPLGGDAAEHDAAHREGVHAVLVVGYGRGYRCACEDKRET